jgi:KEOPS complex subunit Pcc1
VVHEAQFSLVYSGVGEATLVAESLRPEIGDIEGDRTRATLEREGAEVELLIEADDFVALRAGINTWLSLAGVAERAGGIGSGDVELG